MPESVPGQARERARSESGVAMKYRPMPGE